MHFEILTLFPEIFASFLNESLIKKAADRGLISVGLTNFRPYGLGRHLKVDDEPYGGGPGMILRVEPLAAAIRERSAALAAERGACHRVMLTPQGAPLRQARAAELARLPGALMLVCGRYEGFDERLRAEVDEELSIGDFVCLGGEVPAMLVVEAVGRLIPGVVGNTGSVGEESHAAGLLEYPQYTRPPEFEGRRVPEVLLSGHHGNVARWRREQSLARTRERRPDLAPRGGQA